MDFTICDPPKNTIVFLQSTIIGEVSKLYDRSIWTIRHCIRNIEKGRPATTARDSDFAQLHNLARHIIHTCEVLGVAVDTITELIEESKLDARGSCKCINPTAAALQKRCPHKRISFWLKILQNFRGRAESLNARLSNEINLGFNVVVQRDSKATVEISQATRSDSASMKTIAVVTLALLPATFVSTVFSMSFFTLSVDDNTGEHEWLVSERFWIYWVITIPLTAITLLCWMYGQHMEEIRFLSALKSRKSKA
ncbi:uncharacterized protein Z518_07795 [Rhinocladiella mackenziei CBS 650.93]|uniref:Uncharacterized protein n=1 Tax=Rhinocladiella mackenziei CBS 650.93 TaxID=1442369 RepID=A0A0D2IM45_9EURO|nr:uncharacterized protein Z518_07795 [Rhinocladiella mackenziei CBS 650.93]KIX04241.1 hypothetical protein Z518_07795 [Rhinocladiella mackenziei CBS 650.93]